MNSESQPEDSLQPGLSAEVKIIVGETTTAAYLGSGSIPVYGTPALITLMENAAVTALEDHLPPGYTSVGGQIDLRHMAATPVGMQVYARAELTEVKGRKLSFHIQAWDEVEQVGEANHVRYLVNEETFMTKVKSKGK